MAFLALSLILCLVCANYLLHRDVMYPGFLQATLWFVAVSVLLMSQGMFIPVSDNIFVLLVAGVVLFSIGAFVGSYRHKPHLIRTYVLEGTLPSNRAAVALAGAVALGLILYASRARYLASAGPSSNPLINLRLAVSVNQEETGGFGVAAYFVMLANVLAAIVILKRHGLTRPTGSRFVVGITVLIGAVFGALSSGRGPLLALMIIVLTIPAVLRVARPARTGAGLVLVTLLLFTAVGITLGKGGNVGSSLSENWLSMRQSFVTYSVGSIPALDVYIHNRNPDLEWGQNTFRTIFAVLRGFGFHAVAVPLVQPDVDVPMPFNAFTIYHPYMKDFGALGALAVLFVLGFLHAELYRRATVRNPHAIYVFLFAVSIFPLVMQVFQDMYFSLLSLWIQYGTYAVVFFVVLNERRYSSRLSTPATE